METVPTISNMNPNVVKVDIDLKIVFSSFAYQKEETHKFSFVPNNIYMCRVPCPNKDCIEGYFDLSSEVFSAAKSGDARKGSKKGIGQEEKYKHTKGFHYDTTLYYEIESIL